MKWLITYQHTSWDLHRSSQTRQADAEIAIEVIDVHPAVWLLEAKRREHLPLPDDANFARRTTVNAIYSAIEIPDTLASTAEELKDLI